MSQVLKMCAERRRSRRTLTPSIAAGQRTLVAEPQGPPASSAANAPQAPSGSPLPKLLVLDRELTGDLGGPEFVAEHDARLKKERARLRQDLQPIGTYRLMDSSPIQAALDRLISRHRLYGERFAGDVGNLRGAVACNRRRSEQG